MTKAKRPKGGQGGKRNPPWALDELEVLFALREEGLKGSALLHAINSYCASSSGITRTASGMGNTILRKSDTVITEASRKIARAIMSGTTYTQGAAKPKARRKKQVPEEAPPLSEAAKKHLEAKLAVHRLRIETPDQSVELAVSGKHGELIFKGLVASLKTHLIEKV